MDYLYKATVTRVVDGDTFDADVDLGFRVTVRHRFRVYDLDTPETWRPKSEAEAEHGARATELATTLIQGEQVQIESFKIGIYGRYVAKVTMSNGGDFATAMKESGMEKLKSYVGE